MCSVKVLTSNSTSHMAWVSAFSLNQPAKNQERSVSVWSGSGHSCVAEPRVRVLELRIRQWLDNTLSGG